MAAELQQLLEKIQRDGVEKANAEAAAILKKAQEKAAAIVKDAEEKAAAAREKAEAEAKGFEERARTSVAQAARDTVIKTQNDVTALLEAILVKDVNAALSDPAVAVPLAADAIRELVKGGEAEIAAGAKLADALRARLAADAASGVTVVTDETARTGFSVRLNGGRVEHDFTGPVLAAALASRLRPALAQLVK